MAEEIATKEGKLDILINNAGMRGGERGGGAKRTAREERRVAEEARARIEERKRETKGEEKTKTIITRLQLGRGLVDIS